MLDSKQVPIIVVWFIIGKEIWEGYVWRFLESYRLSNQAVLLQNWWDRTSNVFFSEMVSIRSRKPSISVKRFPEVHSSSNSWHLRSPAGLSVSVLRKLSGVMKAGCFSLHLEGHLVLNCGLTAREAKKPDWLKRGGVLISLACCAGLVKTHGMFA